MTAAENSAARLVKRAIRCSEDDQHSEEISDEALKALKQFARQSDVHIALVAEECFAYLAHKKSSRIRFLALQSEWPHASGARHRPGPRASKRFTRSKALSTPPSNLPSPMPEQASIDACLRSSLALRCRSDQIAPLSSC